MDCPTPDVERITWARFTPPLSLIAHLPLQVGAPKARTQGAHLLNAPRVHYSPSQSHTRCYIGTDIAIEAADFVLMRSNLQVMP